MREAVEELSWLPLSGDDFRQQCRQVDPSSAEAGPDLWRLANHRLDLNQLTLLCRALDRCKTAANPLRSLAKVKLAILSNSTVSPVVAALRASALRYGFDLEVLEGEFGNIAQQALDPTSTTAQWKPDLVLLSVDHRALPLIEDVHDAAAAGSGVA